jgi:tetraacyldisaccharide 4'-kinase
MPFKTPSFWFQKSGILSALLVPVSWLYQAGHIINQKLAPAPYKSSLPVICVGNAIAGGGGKTPTVIALKKILKNYNAVVLTRGYGGTISEATLVDAEKHSVKNVGDEALLISRHLPVIVCHNRADGAKLAERNNFDLIIMDDGLQNNSLVKTVTLLVIDRQIDFGNGKMIPAGPLREPLAKVLNKSDAVICIGRPLQSDLPVFEAMIEPQGNFDISKNYIAFAGLGIPEKFKNSLLDLNAKLVGWQPYADHHTYNKDDIKKLQQQAILKNAVLITTEKDHLRLPRDVANDVQTLPIKLKFTSPQTLADFITTKINSTA